MLDVWKPEPGRFRDGGVSSWSVFERLQHTMSTLSIAMIASHGRDPRHGLILHPPRHRLRVDSSLVRRRHHRHGVSLSLHASPQRIPATHAAQHHRSPRRGDQRCNRHLLVGRLRFRQHHRDRHHLRHDRVGIIIFTHTSYTRIRGKQESSGATAPHRARGAPVPTSKRGSGPNKGGSGRRARQRGDGPGSNGAKSHRAYRVCPMGRGAKSQEQKPAGQRSVCVHVLFVQMPAQALEA
jgi:hypothetical protein